ncbi:hypothetical protein BDW62DRAFT_175337 [Aspergillus aurantiobrunneus]
MRTKESRSLRVRHGVRLTGFLCSMIREGLYFDFEFRPFAVNSFLFWYLGFILAIRLAALYGKRFMVFPGLIRAITVFGCLFLAPFPGMLAYRLSVLLCLFDLKLFSSFIIHCSCAAR